MSRHPMNNRWARCLATAAAGMLAIAQGVTAAPALEEDLGGRVVSELPDRAALGEIREAVRLDVPQPRERDRINDQIELLDRFVSRRAVLELHIDPVAAQMIVGIDRNDPLVVFGDPRHFFRKLARQEVHAAGYLFVFVTSEREQIVEHGGHRSRKQAFQIFDQDDEVLRGPGHRGTVGAKVAVAHFFAQKLHKSKKTGTSNWASSHLTERQLLYAANDAHVALRLYRAWLATGGVSAAA